MDDIVDIVDNKACPAFAGRYIKNVKNIESPDWLKNKLKSIGLRPISALVDITNFVMFDMNRPLHVYDADKINEKIIVRSSQKGESFKALDDKEYHLEDGMCVIADKSKVSSLPTQSNTLSYWPDNWPAPNFNGWIFWRLWNRLLWSWR